MRRTLFFTSLVASFIIGCGIIGCGGTNASSPVPPPQTPVQSVAQTAPPAGSQHEEPAPPPAPPGPPVRGHLTQDVPTDWARVPGQPYLLNVSHSPLIHVSVYEASEKNAEAELKETIAQSPTVKAGKIETSPDGLRAWVTFTGTDPKVKQKGRIVVRQISKEQDTPATVMVECYGIWPANFDAQFTKDLDAYVNSYRFK